MRFLLAEYERTLWVMPEASVLIVENDTAKVEADLVAGLVSCPFCGGVLAPWSFARPRLSAQRPGRSSCAHGVAVAGAVPTRTFFE